MAAKLHLDEVNDGNDDAAASRRSRRWCVCAVSVCVRPHTHAVSVCVRRKAGALKLKI